MRLTARQTGKYRGAGMGIPAPVTSRGSSIPVPVGGWDAYSQIQNMPPQNAVELINWFPQPGWVELRKGFLNHVDTGTGEAVDSLMAYQGPTTASNRLFAASDGEIFDVTGSPASSVLSGLANNRWQHLNFATSGGNHLWICNGADTPRAYDGSAWSTMAITGVTPEDIIACASYRSRIWVVLKDSTQAAYLPLDSIQGAATTLELGTYFTMGGQLKAIGTWSTGVSGGTNEFICFVSSFGEVAIFIIYDPTADGGFNFVGSANIGSPIGTRCLTQIGADLGLITIDGVLPLSQVVNYDRAALQAAAITKNIRTAMADAAKDYKDNFGWQIISYPRSTMAILNVPIVENGSQQQFVMNTITGSWARFTGQNANCWEIFEDRAYFGNNDGVVCIADASAGDQDQTLEADIQGAYNYFGARGRNKRWTTLRPLITKDTSFLIQLSLGLSIDFQLNDTPDAVIDYGAVSTTPIWDDPGTVWDEAQWPGVVTDDDWIAVSGIGYNAAVRLRLSVPWTEDLVGPKTLRINGFDVLYDDGAFI